MLDLPPLILAGWPSKNCSTFERLKEKTTTITYLL